MRRLHEVTLPPLLHVLYRYGAAFSPHAQNCLLVLRDDVPVRLVVKDFVDDMMVSGEPLPELAGMPADVRRRSATASRRRSSCSGSRAGCWCACTATWPSCWRTAWATPSPRSGRRRERVVAAYQERFEDELGDRFALFDIDAPAFVKLCLNRVRMLERGYADAAARPVAAAAGWIDNPLAPVSEPGRGCRGRSRVRIPGWRCSCRSSPSTSSTSPRSTASCGRGRRCPSTTPSCSGPGCTSRTSIQFWAMDWPQDWIRDYLVRQNEDPARSPLLGFVDDVPVGYIEVYDPARDVLGAHAPVLPGDIGAHVLIGEEEHLGRYRVAIGRAVVRFLFRRPGVLRIVGEPDVRNHNFLSLLAFLGFRRAGEIDLPDKRAAFMVCEREDFERLSGRRRRVSA